MEVFLAKIFDLIFKIGTISQAQDFHGSDLEFGIVVCVLFFVNWIFSRVIHDTVTGIEEFYDEIKNIEWKHVFIALISASIVLVVKSNFSALLYSLMITLLIWMSIFDFRLWMTPDIMLSMLFSLGAIWAITDIFPLESFIAAIMTFVFFKLIQLLFRGKLGEGDVFVFAAMALVFGFEIYQVVLTTGLVGIILFAIRRNLDSFGALIPAIALGSILQMVGIGDMFSNLILSIF